MGFICGWQMSLSSSVACETLKGVASLGMAVMTVYWSSFLMPGAPVNFCRS